MNLRTFASNLVYVSVEDYPAWTDSLCCVAVKLADGKHALQSGAAACICVNHVYFAVFVPEWGSVDDSFACLYDDRLAPRTFHILCLGHERTLVGVAPKDVEKSVVMADAWCPHAVSVLRLLVIIGIQCVRNCCADKLPVYHILGM